MTAPMTPDHPRWDEFCKRLEGDEGCNFHKNETGEVRWYCRSEGPNAHAFTTAVLIKMDFTDEAIAASIEYFEEHGGGCDCEILFNVRRSHEMEKEDAAR